MDNKESDKKLEYLKREEIRTMQKDIARLREAEAQKEREIIAKLKTGEEAKKEKEEIEKAETEAMERGKAEEEAKRRQEQLKKLREEREERERLMGEETLKKGKLGTEEFKEKLKESQKREEEERRKFLERVEAKVEGRIEMPAPEAAPEAALEIAPELKPEPEPAPEAVPGLEEPPKPEVPAVPAPKLKLRIPRISGVFPQKPSLFEKVWIRIVVLLLVLTNLAIIATFWYWYLVVREKTPQIPPAPPPMQPLIEEILPSPALISTSITRTLEVAGSAELADLISQISKEDFGQNRFIRILIKNTATNQFLGLKEFFEALEVKTPEGFYNKINNDFTLFVYSSQGRNRLGFVAQIIEGDLSDLLNSWEPTMEKDLEKLFSALGKTKGASIPGFKTAGYKNESFRYLSFSPDHFGIVWARISNYLIFTSSGESMMKIIDKLKE